MTEKENILLKQTIEFVKNEFIDAEGGHDWWHTYRVWKMAIGIAKEENANQVIVQLAALLHDIADSKFHNGDEEIGPKTASDFLTESEADINVIHHVIKIIRHLSFKKSFDNIKYSSLELDVVRDADRLDAIGAIGIARTFNYGGFKGSEIYNPNIKPVQYGSKKEYKSGNPTTINHFYEKLLKLKTMMNTNTGKKLAKERHLYMEQYLDQFFSEWEGLK